MLVKDSFQLSLCLEKSQRVYMLVYRFNDIILIKSPLYTTFENFFRSVSLCIKNVILPNGP